MHLLRHQLGLALVAVATVLVATAQPAQEPWEWRKRREVRGASGE